MQSSNLNDNGSIVLVDVHQSNYERKEKAGYASVLADRGVFRGITE